MEHITRSDGVSIVKLDIIHLSMLSFPATLSSLLHICNLRPCSYHYAMLCYAKFQAVSFAFVNPFLLVLLV